MGSSGAGSGGEPLLTRIERHRTENTRTAPCTVGIDTDDASGVYGNHQCVHKTLNFVNCSAAANHFHLKVPDEVRAALLLPPFSYRSASSLAVCCPVYNAPIRCAKLRST